MERGDIGNSIKCGLNGRILAAALRPDEGNDADDIIDQRIVTGAVERGRSLLGIRHRDVGVGW